MRIQGTVNPRLPEIARAFQLTPKLMAELAVVVDRRFGEHERALFQTEGATGGKKWAPLSPEYAKRKAGLRRSDQRFRSGVKALGLRRLPMIAGNKILTLGGGLRDSLTRPTNPDHLREVTGTRIAVGTRNATAGYHFTGTPRMPQRDPIQHTDAQRRAYFTVIGQEFAKRATAAMRSIAGARTYFRGSA